MRSRLASRSARAALAVAAAATLTATTATTAATALADSGDTVRKSDVGQVCGTNDLSFTLSRQSQAGGYFLIAAKALPGITCHLEGTFPSAGFGSAADTHVTPIEQGVSETIKLSGSTTAYAGINPKSTDSADGRQFSQLFVAVAGYEADAVAFRLSEPVLVDKPVATNWHTDPADAVPYIG
ncbi:hypothetical protein TU94_32365 [Streptomyces cyaneogriseus subsp. noncyanogenus]|uniref:DUF4232 domain-containing protein n=1 Tax=Streptomyces cyaneogriseus subsp. noncyanogenus TaxID=477245 RepID=A0A0C5G5W3_9ACTN|nr:DUF4232 domain-containing protein [Streptomyces cyaneogriseus]AJP05403.1 hypothetical protein TU94_32365 [Streptomyces cyaneogriseus subsp. noncyanogenus]